MRIAQFLFVLGGGIGLIYLGATELSSLNSLTGKLKEAVGIADKIRVISWVLIGSGISSMVIAFLVFRKRIDKILAAVILCVIALLPMIFLLSPLYGSPIAIAALLAFLIKEEQ